MRNKYILFLLIACCMLCINSTFAVRLSGNYTIDSLSAPTTSNFRNFASAVTYLTGSGSRSDGGPSNAAPFGVSGPVVFNVAAGIYPVTSIISIDSIAGTSPVNTVTFTGGTGNASTRVISSSLGSAIIRLNGCKYVSLRELTVTNNFSGICAGIAIIGNLTSNLGTANSIKNCVVNIPNAGAGNAWGINVTSDISGLNNFSVRVDSLRIDSNRINGGFWGINFYGAKDTLRNFDNKFRNNVVSNAYSIGIRIGAAYNAYEVSNNNVWMNTDNNTSIGISSDSMRTGVTSTAVALFYGNRVTAVSRALSITAYVTYPHTAVKVYNNMLVCAGDNTLCPLYINSVPVNTGNIDCLHNTVYSKNTENYTVFYNGAATGSRFKNNIFIASSLTGYAAQFSTNITGNEINGNIYYNTSGGNLLKRGTVDYNSSLYQSIVAGGDSSFNYLPAFISPATGDLRLKDACAERGINLTADVPADINGQTRSGYPSIGCTEVTAVINNLAADALVTDVLPITATSFTVKVRFKNIGSNTVHSAVVGYKLNNDPVVTDAWIGTLNVCDTISHTFQMPVVLANGKNTIRFFVSLPNNTQDNELNNDTITTVLYPSLSGNYTIGGTGADFSTFAEATNALKTSGIAGPVTFTVNPGTYTEQVIIDKPLNGTSNTDTIVFDGVNSSLCTITASLPAKAVVIINQCNYVTFRNFTVNNTTTSGASGIAVLANISNGNGSNNRISKCNVNLSSTPGVLSYAITVTSSENGYGAYISRADSITIDSNVITNGYNGISFYGAGNAAYNRNYKISYNTITNTFMHGIYLNRNFNAIDVLYNKVSMSTAPAATVLSIGILHQSNTISDNISKHRLIGNRVLNSNSAFIQVQSTGSTTTNPALFYNNMVGGALKAATSTGINISLGGVVEFYHNTINITAGGASIRGLTFSGTAPGGIFQNNIFSVTATAGTTVYPANFTTNPSQGANPVDYNQYYNAATNTALSRGGIRDNLNFATAAAGGVNSIFAAPVFVSNTNDFHITERCSHTGANLTAIVPLDIDGDVRNNPPLVGSDEYTGLANDIAIEKIVGPVSPLINGSMQDVVIRVTNKGNNVITSFNLNYSVNGGTVQTQAWTGSLNPCSTADVTFTGSQQITISASNAILAYTNQPNNSTDPVGTNDTLRVTYKDGIAAGTYTIGTGGTYATFAAATNDLSSRGILGPVTFNVLAGTYAEQVSVNGPIAGSSFANKITFDGIDSATRIVSVAAPLAPVFKVNKADYVTVKNLSVRNLATGGCAGISLVAGSTNQAGTGFTVKRCTVRFPNVSASQQDVYGILLTGISSGANEGYQWADSVTIDSNILVGGYSGITVKNTQAGAGSAYNKGYKIRGNRVINAYGVGIDFSYVFNAGEISNNTITMNTANTTSFGINSDYNQNATAGTRTVITNNRITASGIGIYMETMSSPLGDRILISNNICLVTNSVLGFLGGGLYLGGAGEVEVYHNTFSATHSTTPSCLQYASTTTGTSYFKNNIISVNSVTAIPALFATNPGTGNVVDYNIYYNASGGPLVQRNGTTYNSTNFKVAAAGGDSSLNMIPPFVSATDLTLSNGCTRGVNLNSIVPADIFGTVRANNPVIGAHEAGFANDVAVESVSYATPFDIGAQDITVAVRNFSAATVTSMNIHLRLNSGAVITYPWTGSIPGCSSLPIVVGGPNQVNIPAGLNVLTVYLTSPNGMPDNSRANDTLRIAISTLSAKPGNAFSGNGVSSSKFIRMPHTSVMTPVTAMSAEAWIKLTNVTTTQKIIAKSSSRVNGFSMGVQSGSLHAEIFTAAGAAPFVLGGTIPVNTWTHVAMTWESGVGLKTYINGELAGTALSSTVTTMQATSSDLFIGMNSWDNTQNTSGSIDEVRLWNIALDTLTLRKNMHRTLRRAETGLISYLQLNEATSSALVSDPISGSSGAVRGSGTLVASTIPAGGDSALANPGVYSGYFSEGILAVNIGDPFDIPSDFVITEIPLVPNVLPSATNKLSDRYWILRAFGTPGVFSASLTFQFPNGYLDPLDNGLALYKRKHNDTAQWTLYKTANSVSANTLLFFDIDTFGQFTVASAGTSQLPVSLISFSGRKTGKGTLLNWNTAAEINSKLFKIERSYNNLEAFEEIGEVEAAGNTKSVTSYEFTDARVNSSNTAYYRLKQVDQDGKYRYSPIVTIFPEEKQAGLTVYPNPVKLSDVLLFDAEADAHAVVSLTDIKGKIITSYNYEANAGSNKVNVDVDALVPGVYFLSVEINNEKKTTKVIRQ